MEKLLRLGACTLNQIPLDWEGNYRRIVEVIREARTQGVSILCLPELCICGYGCEDMFLSKHVELLSLELLEKLKKETSDIAVCLGLPLTFKEKLYNATCLVANNQILGFVAKQNLARDGIHYETRWFTPWNRGEVARFELNDGSYPLGDIIFDFGGVRVGFEICEDAWVKERPGRKLSHEGVDIILNPSASHFAFGKHLQRKQLVIQGSREFDVAYLYANLLGNEAGRAIYDGGAMVAKSGELLCASERFSFKDFQLVSAPVKVGKVKSGEVDAKRVIKSSFEPIKAGSNENNCISPWLESSADLKEEEFVRVVALGLFDYLRKSKHKGFVVGLSGGADSATVAVLVSYMVALAVSELGVERFKERVSISELKNCRASGAGIEKDFVTKLLTCVYQATENSSEITRKAAKQVAEALGASFIELNLSEVVSLYTKLAEYGVKRSLNWREDDLTLQNIQARVRAPSIWMLANIKQALLLATSNRSEVAVGYATMDGDTAGGLSPIAGVDKAFIRKWLVWAERKGPAGLFSVPELSAINVQAPTAELRPKEYNQTDESDLMPYEALDKIERLAIRDKLSPKEIFKRLVVDNERYNESELKKWIEKFFKLWCRSQWKRERLAPSFHLDDENLDPRSWFRFPILSGGFEREIEELKRQ